MFLKGSEKTGHKVSSFIRTTHQHTPRSQYVFWPQNAKNPTVYAWFGIMCLFCTQRELSLFQKWRRNNVFDNPVARPSHVGTGCNLYEQKKSCFAKDNFTWPTDLNRTFLRSCEKAGNVTLQAVVTSSVVYFQGEVNVFKVSVDILELNFTFSITLCNMVKCQHYLLSNGISLSNMLFYLEMWSDIPPDFQ